MIKQNGSNSNVGFMTPNGAFPVTDLRSLVDKRSRS